jgi:hypothetical protein
VFGLHSESTTGRGTHVGGIIPICSRSWLNSNQPTYVTLGTAGACCLPTGKR